MHSGPQEGRKEKNPQNISTKNIMRACVCVLVCARKLPTHATSGLTKHKTSLSNQQYQRNKCIILDNYLVQIDSCSLVST